MGNNTSLKIDRAIIENICDIPLVKLSKISAADQQLTGDRVKSSELWDNKCAVIFIVRRPGCPMCRYSVSYYELYLIFLREQAQILSEKILDLSTTLDILVDPSKLCLAAIVHDEDSVDDIHGFCEYFCSKKNGFASLQGQVYFDQTQGFYHAQGFRRMTLFSLVSAKVRKAYNRAIGKGIKGSYFGGDGSLLGGVLVVANNKIWYEHREAYFGDLAPIDEVLDAIECATKSSVDRTVSINVGVTEF